MNRHLLFGATVLIAVAPLRAQPPATKPTPIPTLPQPPTATRPAPVTLPAPRRLKPYLPSTPAPANDVAEAVGKLERLVERLKKETEIVGQLREAMPLIPQSGAERARDLRAKQRELNQSLMDLLQTPPPAPMRPQQPATPANPPDKGKPPVTSEVGGKTPPTVTPAPGEKEPRPIKLSEPDKPQTVNFPPGIENRPQLADLFFRVRKYDRALHEYQAMLKEKVSSEDFRYYQLMAATCHQKLGRLEEAADLYREVVNSKTERYLVQAARWHLDTLNLRQRIAARLEELKKKLEGGEQ